MRNALVGFIALAGLLTAWNSAADAQVEWLRLTLTGAGGYATFDESFETDDGIPLEARAGLSFFRYVGI